MTDMIGILLAVALTAIAGFGAHAYWERRGRAAAKVQADRRDRRAQVLESQNSKLVEPVKPRAPGFGRR